MPGTTQSRWSSDDDEGVGAARIGGDREGRVSADPQGSEGARAQRSPRHGSATGGGWFRERSRSCRSRCRVSKGARGKHGEDCGHALVPRGLVTRQKLLLASRVARSRKGPGARERSDRVADPSEIREGEREDASGQSETKTTVHAAWWSGPRPRVFDLRSRKRSRADTGGHSSAGDARGDGVSEVRRSIRDRSGQCFERDRSARRSGRCGVKPQALASRGNR